MRSQSDSLFQNAGRLAAVVVMATVTCATSVHADEKEAKSLLKAMSDYMAAQETISFEYDTNLEVVTKQQQKLALASSGAVKINRPDKLHVTRQGGFANVEIVFDGKTLSFLGKDANLYAQAEVPGTTDNLIDTLRDKFNRPLPAGDMLISHPYDALMSEVVDVKDLGSGVIRGEECDHLAFRTKEGVDWQIWIAQGQNPYPCRYVVTSTKVKGFPQYTIDVRSWKAGADAAAGDFNFKAPDGAKKRDLKDLPDADELPEIFSKK
ncbi:MULTISPECIES: DUF2092 domain-containing protein [Rhizobium]|uniref:DUF2092 domain-containing protein n=1 Tax=Rhizobium TaxID=379 RepID=UPI001B33594B|nr:MULTISPECIES: DUF2092 domain-containing protein [Rhizobium]MBX4906643.1 DUF2092 domain-containing protein [Rhizobium bangladeshense]MBX5213325.1 DUF2092 domain-containing protein [Rhizobium sp. NLR9a]MBX5224980.1 DUF2092 domain-containing protein [Rhizobium sp. NLR9b]MBX5230843.1 DUF2092 domain-containing protein [Rhizobium sp. NLR4a]MBX5243592.1 DUF2092 domain-containing protein [Rhizobium sp. NLR3b]